MTHNRHTYFALGAFMMAIAIILGAFGAHGLQKMVSLKYIATWKTASEYLMYNGIAIMAFSAYKSGHATHHSSDSFLTDEKLMLRVAIYSVFIGTFLFCSSLYLVSLQEVINESLSNFKHVAPFGGTIMALGWFGVGVHFLTHQHPK